VTIVDVALKEFLKLGESFKMGISIHFCMFQSSMHSTAQAGHLASRCASIYITIFHCAPACTQERADELLAKRMAEEEEQPR